MALTHPSKGLFNALPSVIFTDVWKGLSVSVVICIAGLQAIDRTCYEAAQIDGASKAQTLRNITLPLVPPAMNTIIILSLIGALKSFDLIKTMTDGGPGSSSSAMLQPQNATSVWSWATSSQLAHGPPTAFSESVFPSASAFSFQRYG